MTSPAMFRERVFPGLGWMVVGIGIIGMVSVAFGAALGNRAGWLMASTFLLTGGVLAWIRSPHVKVSVVGLHCGRAVLPWGAVGPARILEGSEITSARHGHHPDVRDIGYLVVPGWTTARAVLVPVLDDADPHSAWVIATRHPEALVASLTSPPLT